MAVPPPLVPSQAADDRGDERTNGMSVSLEEGSPAAGVTDGQAQCDVDELRCQLEHEREQLIELEAKLAEARQRDADSRRQLAAIRAEASAERERREGLLQQLQGSIERLQQENASLLHKHEEARAQADSIEQDVKRVQERTRQLQVKMETDVANLWRERDAVQHQTDLELRTEATLDPNMKPAPDSPCRGEEEEFAMKPLPMVAPPGGVSWRCASNPGFPTPSRNASGYYSAPYPATVQRQRSAGCAAPSAWRQSSSFTAPPMRQISASPAVLRQYSSACGSASVPHPPPPGALPMTVQRQCSGSTPTGPYRAPWTPRGGCPMAHDANRSRSATPTRPHVRPLGQVVVPPQGTACAMRSCGVELWAPRPAIGGLPMRVVMPGYSLTRKL